MSIHQPLRNPMNTRLKNHYAPCFEQYDVQQHDKGPLINQYLERTESVFQKALGDYSRVLALRLDLRFPEGYYREDDSNALINQFFKQLQRTVDAAKTKHPTIIRYTWAREQYQSAHPHYHVFLLLNYDTYYCLGAMRPSPSGFYEERGLFHQIVRAWAHVLKIYDIDAAGLVHIPSDPFTKQLYCQRLDRFDQCSISNAFYVASYLCKSFSKPHGNGYHCFGSSRQ